VKTGISNIIKPFALEH